MTAGQVTGGPPDRPRHDRYRYRLHPGTAGPAAGTARAHRRAGRRHRGAPAPAGRDRRAGSGKSETMAARLVWLVANGVVRPERVLGLTFTRKAAAELGQRVRARLDGLRKAGLSLPGQADPGQASPGQASPGQASPGRASRARPVRARPVRARPARASPARRRGHPGPPPIWRASRWCPPTTPTPPGLSPITRCARHWNRRCGSSRRPWPGRSRPGWCPGTAARWTR